MGQGPNATLTAMGGDGKKLVWGRVGWITKCRVEMDGKGAGMGGNGAEIPSQDRPLCIG